MAPRRTCGPPGARSAPDRPDPARPRGGGGAAPLPAAPALCSNPTSSARRARARSHALPAAGVRSTPVPKTLSPAGRLDHSTPPPAAGSNPPADPPALGSAWARSHPHRPLLLLSSIPTPVPLAPRGSWTHSHPAARTPSPAGRCDPLPRRTPAPAPPPAVGSIQIPRSPSPAGHLDPLPHHPLPRRGRPPPSLTPAPQGAWTHSQRAARGRFHLDPQTL